MRGSSQLAEGVARFVRNAPQRRLEQILRTPVRRAVLEGIFWQMPQHFDHKAARTMDATIRWRITKGSEDRADVYELRIKDGRCRARRGERSAEPSVTITLSAGEFVRLATGSSDPMQAYFKGRIKLAGDIMVAARLQTLFRIPGRAEGSQRSGKADPQPSSTVSESR